MGRFALWTSIRDQLENEIAAGRYQRTDKLPTEAALSKRFGVNRHTVRRAIADLIGRGIVHARRGAGVFVTKVPTLYPLGQRVRFHQSVQESGRTPAKRILLLEDRPSTLEESEALALSDGGRVIVCEGLSFADDDPIALFRSVFPMSRVPNLMVHLRSITSITEALKAEGVSDYTRAWTQINAKMASPTLAGHLRVSQGSPILRTKSLNIEVEGPPIEYGRTWFAADRVTLTVGEG